MYILGISCFYHDAAAVIIHDGRIVAAAAEERFTRVKHDNNFPLQAIKYCLSWAGISANELGKVVFYEKPIIKFDRILRQHLEHFPKSYPVFLKTMSAWTSLRFDIPRLLKKHFNYRGQVLFTEHHLSHAASAYYLSNFDKAVIITLDGVGEWATTTVGTGHGIEINIDQQIHFPHSLGLLYSAITSFLGFDVNDAEYKVMGLAGFGKPDQFRTHLNELVTTHPDGSFTLNLKFFDYTWREAMFNYKLSALFGYPPREKEAQMLPHYENIAAALQEKLEAVIFNLTTAAYKKYKIKKLCLAGGVALNSVANGKLLAHTPYTDIYIPPDPSDAGGAMGAALYVYHQLNAKLTKFINPTKPLFTPYLGPSFSEEQMESFILSYKLPYAHYTDRQRLLDDVADLLTKQKIIGWFQGRMEWGPRALGNRSILASAAKSEMKDIINAKVKHREMFRPFAPVILKKYTHQYFLADKNLSPSTDYMLMVYPFTPKGKTAAPATVHVDGTGRLQTIERAANPLYYDLIDTYRKKTGTPIIVNTSFNVRGEPIVCTPQDALNCFLGTEIDYLVMGPFLVKKPIA